MNRKETLTIIGTLTAIFGFMFYNVQTSINDIKVDIKTLSDDIKADRRAMTQRIDFLYQSKTDKKSK